MKRITFVIITIFLFIIVCYLSSGRGCFFELKKSQNDIRIVTWNISNFGWDNGYSVARRDEIVNVLKNIDADFICLQETVLSYDTCKINNLPWVSKTLKMPYHRYSFLRQDQFDDHHQFGDITFSKYPIIHTDSFTTSDERKRYFSIKTVIKGDTVSITNVHLQSNAIENKHIQRFNLLAMYQNYRQNSLLREKHVKELIQIVPKYKSIFLGDFNDIRLSSTYKIINKYYNDAFDICGKGTSITLNKSILKLRIDYIFYGDGIRCKNAGVLDVDISDHRPLIMDFEIF